MELDKTPHGRVIMIIAAYVIGLTTMYLALSAAQSDDGQPPTKPERVVDQASSDMRATTGSTHIEYRDSGFYAVVKDEPVLLSVPVESVGQADGLTFGVHASIPISAVSADGRYVYYCEQLSKSSDTCNNLIFDSKRNVIQWVRTNNQKVLTDSSSVAASWTAVGKLQLNSFASISADAPWLVERVD